MSFFKKLVGSSEKAPANSKDKLLKELQRNMPLLTVEFMKELKEKTEAIRLLKLEADEWDEEPEPESPPATQLPKPTKKEDLKEIAKRMNTRRAQEKKSFWSRIRQRVASPSKSRLKLHEKAQEKQQEKQQDKAQNKQQTNQEHRELMKEMTTTAQQKAQDRIELMRKRTIATLTPPQPISAPSVDDLNGGSMRQSRSSSSLAARPRRTMSVRQKPTEAAKKEEPAGDSEQEVEDIRARSATVAGNSSITITTQNTAAPDTFQVPSTETISLRKKSKRNSAPQPAAEAKAEVPPKKWGTARTDLSAALEEAEAEAKLEQEETENESLKKSEKRPKKKKHQLTVVGQEELRKKRSKKSKDRLGDSSTDTDRSVTEETDSSSLVSSTPSSRSASPAPTPIEVPSIPSDSIVRSASDSGLISDHSTCKMQHSPSLGSVPVVVTRSATPTKPKPKPSPPPEVSSIDVGPGKTVAITRKLGKGAYGTVWEGVLNGRLIALKQISLFDLPKEKKNQIMTQVKKELNVIKPLRHENIVRYYGMFYSRAAQEISIVMELVDGPSVTDVIVYRKSLPEPWAALIVRQALAGLNFLHKNSIIHRDLKPDNMLIDSNVVVKLIDFGTCTKIENNENLKRRSTVGTPWYCSPEVVNSEEYGVAADIWSLGCSLIELLTGKPPYDELNDIACLFKVAEGKRPPLPSGISKECEDFLSKCLEVDQSKRPTAEELLEHPFLKLPPDVAQDASAELQSVVLLMNEERRRADSTE